MQLSVLNSGSNANATVVVEDGHALVIDCGLSARECSKRLSDTVGGVDIDAILLTHEHSDHVAGLSPFARKTNSRVYATEATLEEILRRGIRLDGVETLPVEPMVRFD